MTLKESLAPDTLDVMLAARLVSQRGVFAPGRIGYLSEVAGSD